MSKKKKKKMAKYLLLKQGLRQKIKRVTDTSTFRITETRSAGDEFAIPLMMNKDKLYMIKEVKATVKSFFQKKSEFFFLHHIMQLFMTFPKN